MSVILIIQLGSVRNEMFFILLDAIVVSIAGFILSLVVSQKEEDFFSEMVAGGYTLNKRIEVEGEDMYK
jgi:hypothetical protein